MATGLKLKCITNTQTNKQKINEQAVEVKQNNFRIKVC